MAVLSIYHPFGMTYMLRALLAMQHFCYLLTLHHDFCLG